MFGADPISGCILFFGGVVAFLGIGEDDMIADPARRDVEAAAASVRRLYYYTRPRGPAVPYGEHLVAYRAATPSSSPRGPRQRRLGR